MPAGSVFSDAELVYSVYDGYDCDAARDVERLQTVLEGLQLVEDDYLGGLGSRGSGKVRFKDLKIFVRAQRSYLQDAQPDAQPLAEFTTLGKLLAAREEVLAKIRQALAL